jgi:hypothetical protein
MEIKRFSLKMIVVCLLALCAICCCWWSPALALDGATMPIFNNTLTDVTQRGVWQDALTANESMLTSSGSTSEEVSSLNAFSGAQGAGAGGDYSQYSFTFNYTDGSGDKYSGFVYAPTSFQTRGDIVVGTKLYNQPIEMGGGALGGYYDITAVANGYDATYDCQSYITSYYDGDTGKTSYTLDSTTGGTTADTFVYVADRRYTAESGYVYDPSVPASDAYFGSPDVCYSFNTGTGTNSVNFLAAYNDSVSGYYWQKPSSYPGSGAEVAAATLLAFADDTINGASNVITTGWQTLWPNNTMDNPTSYVSFIGTLCTDMGFDWTNYVTPPSSAGPGILTYIQGQGYSTITYDYHDLTSGSRSDSWSAFKSAVTSEPILVFMASPSFSHDYHYGNVLGYWNDGNVAVYWGKGTSFTLDGATYSYPNVKLNFYQTTTGSTQKTAELVSYWYYYDTVQ